MHLDQVAHVTLGFLPTPIHVLEQFSATLAGPQISIKRDDLTGLAFGGNKVRKLEYILAQALQENADCIITAGAMQSNHCRQTAAAAAKLNLECHLVLGGEAPPATNGNLLLDQLLGCHIHWAGDKRKGEDIPELVNKLKTLGKKPYVVPYGGSNELGVLGFVQAMKELYEQSNQCIPYSHIVFASSSGATQAGLMLGRAMLKNNCELIGIAIDKEEINQQSLADNILMLANQTALKLDFNYEFTRQHLNLDENYVAAGYGVIGESEKEAIKLLADAEGVLLDPVYTGRAMAGLIDYVRTKKIKSHEHVLFWHTGGLPALFAYADDVLNL